MTSVILPYWQGRLGLDYITFSTFTFQHGDFALVAVDFSFSSSFSQQARSSFAGKFCVKLHRQIQVDGASLLPLFIAFKFTG